MHAKVPRSSHRKANMGRRRLKWQAALVVAMGLFALATARPAAAAPRSTCSGNTCHFNCPVNPPPCDVTCDRACRVEWCNQGGETGTNTQYCEAWT